MAESSLWKIFNKKLGRMGDHVRVENPAYPGTPDVNYYFAGVDVEGWVELKALPKWPKRASTPVRVDHFTQQQRVWLLRRAAAGGRVYVLLRVDEDCTYILLDGVTAARHLGNVPKAELISLARVYAKGSFPTGEIFGELTRARAL